MLRRVLNSIRRALFPTKEEKCERAYEYFKKTERRKLGKGKPLTKEQELELEKMISELDNE